MSGQKIIQTSRMAKIIWEQYKPSSFSEQQLLCNLTHEE